MMMWIFIGIVVYIGIACVTFLTTGQDNVFAGTAWPLLVIITAVTAITTAFVDNSNY